MLQRKAVPFAIWSIRRGTGFDLDAMDLIACINQAVVGGVVAERNGDIKALA